MCGGLRFKIPDSTTAEMRQVFFPRPHAEIPILDEGDTRLVQWGKRAGEDPEIHVPQTGWARESSLKSDYWQQYQPTLHLIPGLEFAEKGQLKKSRWFPLPASVYLLGLKIEKAGKNFVYVVTNPALGALEKIHPRMPLLVDAQMQPMEIDLDFATPSPSPDNEQLRLL